MTFIDPALFDSLGIFEPGERQAIMQQVAASATPTALATTDPGTPGATTGVGGLTAQQRSAQSIIQATLRTAGLDTPELIKWANDSIVAGATPDQLALELYDPASTAGKVVDRMFPELQARVKNGFEPTSLSYVVDYRNQAVQTARAEGYPVELLDFTKLIGNNMGLPELQTRIRDNYAAIKAALPDVVDQLHTLYGVTTGQIAALIDDPQETSAHLNRQFQAAQIAAAGNRSGFGQLSTLEAENLAGQGVTAAQAQQGLGQLAGMAPLFTPLPGDSAGGITRDQQLAAQFGDSAEAKLAIEREKQNRLAAFGGGGGATLGQRGVGGLGSAATG